MVDKMHDKAARPDPDDDFHMADTDEFETLNEADTDVLHTLTDAEDDQGFDPYNNDKLRQAK